jgi:DNA replication protein DnaC
MQYQKLKENLERLKLYRINEILDNFLERAEKEKLGTIEILNSLFEQELKSKIKRAVDMKMKMAGFPFQKRMKDFDFDFQPSIDRKLISDMETLKFVHNAENIVLLGPPGVGKTHLAIGLGIRAIEAGITAHYINCHNLILSLKQANYENRLKYKLNTLGKYKLLIIDEIGYIPLDKQGANLFFQTVVRRYEKNSIIITSNRRFSEWDDIFGDKIIAAAILDRLLHHAYVINISGKSYRLKERKKLGLFNIPEHIMK